MRCSAPTMVWVCSNPCWRESPPNSREDHGSMAKTGQEQPSRNEDEYFAKQDAELIKQMRAQLDKEREKNERKAHFMKCPKCGADMKEEDHGPVKVDVCPECNGMFLDAGEMALLQKAQGTAGTKLFGSLFGSFAGKGAARK